MTIRACSASGLLTGIWLSLSTVAAASGQTPDSTLGRFLIDKQFRGDLRATSRGQMLTGLTHDPSTPQQTISVVPDSGTGEQAGRRPVSVRIGGPPGQGTGAGR